MTTTNKVSSVVGKQLPQFVEDTNPLFGKFLEYYYKSQEKTGYGQNILNDFLRYLNIDELNVSILAGSTKIVESINSLDTEIIVENVDKFLEKNGSILINDEVIFYEKAISSPSIALSPGISYNQVKVKWTTLQNLINDFDGSTTRFPLLSQQSPVLPLSAQHLIVELYGEILIPGVDFFVESSNIVFQVAPRAKSTSDDSGNTSITFLEGFSENEILVLDDVSTSFGDNRTTFNITRNGDSYQPVVDEYIIAIYDGQILTPKTDFTFDSSTITFNFIPLIGRQLSLFSIEAPIPSFGSGGVGFARVNDAGELTSIVIDQTGSDYRSEYPPKVSIKSSTGSNASAIPLINGIKNTQLLNGGKGYSQSNPPTVVIESPTKIDGTVAKIEATVGVDGNVTELTVIDSGNGYTFVPRVTFKQPGGAKLAPPTMSNGSISGTIQIVDSGQGYTTAPVVYVDQPTGDNPIAASLRAVVNSSGEIGEIEVLNPGQGYTVTPRIAIIDPVGAQVLETKVDADGRVVDIELLSGGSGYDDVPSVYIVDDRINDVGASIGGTGAKASAAIFNGQITDINITNFGSGYSQQNPPKIVIQSPPNATASVEIGLGEVTGFEVISRGQGYSKCKFTGCARAASGITGYTTAGEVQFSGETLASSHDKGDSIKCLDAFFVKRLLDKYTELYLPDIPALDYENIDVRTAIKNIKTFYSTKGTSFGISYLFKLLYGEDVSISYPKDQIIKPSSATWSVNTILRATLASGDPTNIKDALVQQFADIADTNVRDASALVENYISIKTSDVEIFELVLSEETISGQFVVPYKTKLVEGLSDTSDVITVDSTIGWPERNGEFIIEGQEVIRYKEKSLNQFIECTRGSNNTTAQVWDAASEVKSNFQIFLNKDTLNEVVMNIVGIVDAQQTTLSDTGSYYLPGDKLTVSKLGGTTQAPQLTDWLYNVKKLIEIDNITFGGLNNQSATVTCDAPHGLLVGDQVTVYGANPIIYNGTFEVSSRDSSTVFQYILPQPAQVDPQGNILISVDLNKGKSTDTAIEGIISLYTTNVQNTFFNDQYVYVASTGIPNYNIGPFTGSALLPGNQRKLNRFPLITQTISTKTDVTSGPIGTWINGVSAWSYKSTEKKTFGALTSINITNTGNNYDAERPPVITVSGGGGSGAEAEVVVDGSLTEIEVTSPGSGYTSSPLVSIVGGGGSGASATAIVTKGVVSRILVNNGGQGYTSKPSITIVGGGGTGAQGNASVRGPVKSVTIVDGGSSYTSKPDITLSSGVGAVAQAIVSNGRIISIAIISGGIGYTTAPEVTISGDGFGAVAKANIDLDGENAGKVTSIEILNRGIGYTQGLTQIGLTSVGADATFDAQVFEWTYNLETISNKDSAKGFIFEGINNQYGGEYAHVSNPQRLRYILGDNLILNSQDEIVEQETQLEHSPIIGWAFDGNPIYGPYSYEDPTDQTTNLIRMRSSYGLKPNLVFDANSNPNPSRIDGPLLGVDPAGSFVEDFQYNFGTGDLDQYNGRFCKTPDFPEGRYCYFVTIDATESGNAVFPYILGPSYNSIVDMWNLSINAIQQNIPTGVVRYRDPYENVDIDVTRIPNASSNALTTEDGRILLFDPEDENRDGVIDQSEIDDPEQLFEESPLQLYDYFPKVKFDSKVDIEVETIEKFEDASVSGFIVENPGKNYQVNDILVFDNTDTDGVGISARISKIQGETVTSYVYETVENISYGILTTSVPHNIVAGDSIFVDYSPIMDNTNKTYVARQYKGVEEIVVTQNGSGYNVDIPPVITIDGDGENAVIEAELTSVGSISKFNIVNSGHGFVNNPRIISSHPQVFKKANYYASLISNNSFVKINDIIVSETKEVYICGKTLDAQGDTVGFVSKISALGIKEWEKTLESNAPAGTTTYMEFERMIIDGSDIYVVGHNRPNQAILDSYNPDIILVKYTESTDGLDATLSFQKAYSGISGSSRADNVTSLIQLSADRFVIGGFTNTNSSNPQDAFVAILDTAGTFVIKRKFATNNDSEKILDLIEKNGNLYVLMELSDTLADGDKSLVFGKCNVSTTLITVDYLKKIENTVYSFIDANFVIDEYDEFYISSTLRLKSDDSSRDSIWVGKFDLTGDLIWNYRYAAPSREVTLVNKSAIDIFGNLNLAYTENNITTGQSVASSLKINYKGEIVNHTTNKFVSSTSTDNNIEGISANALAVDNSGDVYIFGQTSWNTNEFVLEFATDFTDKTQHYTPTVVGNDATQALVAAGDGIAKFFAKDVANPSNWENAYLKFVGSNLGNTFANDWTLDFMIYKDATNSDTHSQTQHTLVAIGDATDATGGLWLYYDDSSGRLSLVVTNNQTAINNTGSALQSTQTTLYADDTWQFVSLTRNADVFTVYVNGVQIATGSILNTTLGGKDLYIGNIPGRNGTTGTFRSNEQGQFYLDNLRLRNRAVTPTVPSDVTGLPPTVSFALAYDWVDDNWFADHTARYAYIDYVGFGVKVDKDADSIRIGNIGVQANTQIAYERANVTPVSGNSLTVSVTEFTLGASGLQSLDYNETATTHTAATGASTVATDLWSSRNATIPAPGSQKVQASAIVKDRYFFKQTDTIKIDNVQRLTLNQPFRVTVGSKLVLNDGASFVNSGYVTSVDNDNKYVFVAINNNEWTNDTNIGELSTERFDEQSTYGVKGPIVNDINEIENYEFLDVTASTPGTFNIDLANYDAPSIIGGSNNLDEFGKFKDYGPSVFLIKIGETSGTTTYIPGSVVEVPSANITFNTAKSTIQITGLTGVTKISLTTSLNKILKVTSVDNSDTVYVISNNSHYLSQGDIIYVDGNPTNEYNGSFRIDTVISVKEFTYKLAAAATSLPAPSAGSVSVFAKSPILKMYYGHQYIFDVSHSTMLNTNLSFSKDSLNKLQYSFNTIDRIGTPGVTGEGQPSPSVKFKLDKSIVTNISYYFDPSRVGEDSPVSSNSFLDIVDSPYIGTFVIESTTGGTITSGDDQIRFALPSEPEGNGEIINTTYTTSSEKAVGSIGDIRIVNSGGFYTKLPTVDRINSNRKIERVQINEPGTEYAVGVYLSVPIQGDGEGGFVQITVANTTDSEGVVTPGQITEVKVTSPGKGYTTASIDIQAVEGILGPGLTGSGADLEVVIPPFGTGASIFTKGTNIGKIKKLTNNNFGYDYPHDYTLRPEITFPINAQLINTSILQSITITNPGSGYTQAPIVTLTGGGGSGAVAEATIKNGRLDTIVVKDPGAGYSTEPNVELKSSFNYVVNLDLGLLQFAFPHGIVNGSEITLNVVDVGDGAGYPVASGAIGTLNNNTTYYAITGAANSLDDDQMKIAITQSNADLGDAISFINAGVGRQQVLTSSFGGAATANVGTSVFLEGEFIYQGDSIENATATGYVSGNNGWQVGSRIIKIVDYDGEFNLGQQITGTISKSSGIIGDLKIAKGVLEIGPITKTTGQFVDDVGKPSEIIQRIQDSYFYQDFSYAINSSVSIEEWKNTVIKNVHPASFKVFGQLEIQDNAQIPNKETFFELTKSVELTRDAVVPNIQSFALAEPIYQDFNNTEVLFRQKRLTSSENILTSVVQRLDDISDLFDGVRTQFPITVDGDNVIANSNQLMIVLNGVVQTPEESFQVLNDSIVFVEPPQPVASVKYVSVGIEQIPTKLFTFTNFTGIFPPVGNYINGVASGARARVVGSAGDTVTAYITEGTFNQGELITSSATGFTANLLSLTDIANIGLFRYGETIRNIDGDTAKVERINLASGQETPLAQLRFNIGVNTATFDVVTIDANGNEIAVAPGVFEANNQYQIASEIFTVTSVTQNVGYTTLAVDRAQLGTTSIGHLSGTPIYGTDIEVTDSLLLSKTTGTYQSTPGLFDIQLNDVIIAAGSNVVARITSTSPYQDPVTQQFVDTVTISEGSSFSGLLFNRITSQTYPNVILDNLSQSQVNIVNFDNYESNTAFNSKFPANEIINNYIVKYISETGAFTEGETVRNYKVDYGNVYGQFAQNDLAFVRKLSLTGEVGDGFFSRGQVIRSENTKAEVLGYNRATDTVYLGKMGRSKPGGQDYHAVTFAAGTHINSYNEKFGTGCLALSPGTSPHTFVSGVADAITAGGGASGQFTAAAGTTYNPFTGDMVIEIGSHSLTTSNTVIIADDGVVFTCDQDNNTSQKAYPRATDPASGSARNITAVTGTTITVNVGAVPIDEYASIATSTDFGFGTSDFTVECWINPTSVAAGGKAIFDFRTAATELSPYVYLDGAVVKYYVNGADVITGATNLVAGTWYHVAVCKSGSTTKLFLNGVQQGSDYSDSNNYGSTKPIRIGADYNATSVFAGYVDEFRVSTSARYASAFSAPTGINQGDSNTVLLLHFDGDNYQTWTEDWSGEQNWTNGHEFNNDAILSTSRENASAPGGFVGNSHRYLDAANLINANKEFLAKEIEYLIQPNLPTQLNTTNPSLVINSPDYNANDYFSYASAHGNNKFVIGSYLDDDPAGAGNENGSVYVFSDSGQFETKLQASDAAADDQFGYSVSVGSNKIAVGAPSADVSGEADAGAVYVYDLDGSNEAKITPSDVATKKGASFGHTVKIGSSKIVVGAPIMDSTTTNPGTVYVYDLNGTNEVIITPSDGAANDNFGYSVAIDEQNNKIIVGAYNDDDNGNNSGSVYVYNLDGTGEVKITAGSTNGAANDNFGTSVDAYNNLIVIGAKGDGPGGSAYLYQNNGTLLTKITASDAAAGDDFGVQVAVNSTAVFVAAGGAAERGIANTGVIYKFDRDGTNEVKLTETTTSTGSQLGIGNLFANGNYVMASSRDSVNGQVYAGRAYIWAYNTIAGNYNYAQEVRDTIDNLTADLNNGSNSHVWDFAATSVDRTSNPVAPLRFAGEESQQIQTYQYVNSYAQNIITNVLVNVTGSHGLTQFTDATITDSSYTSLTQYTPTGATYAPSTGLLEITIGSHSLTTSDRISIATDGITFTCTMDSNATNHSYPRATDPAANAVLPITAVTGTTITVNVGVSPVDQQYAHTYVSSATNAVTVLNYTSADCADVKTTIDNLVSILEDTVTNSTANTPVDHLATVTKVTPTYEYLGAVVDGFIEVPITVSLNDSANSLLYTNQIDTDARSRFKDAANLIRLNRGAIVDKAAYDLLERYPDLGQDMPRNDGGSTDGTLRCKTDMGLILDSLAQDLEDGGNKNVIRAGRFYLGVNDVLLHIRLQVWQSVFAHQRLALYAKQAITGDLTSDNTDNVIIGDWGITNDAVVNFTPTGATYDAATGVMVITIGSHSLALGRRITIADNSLTFTCSQDGNGSNHTYPRSTDPASGANLEIIATTATTITVNVGASPAGQQYAHTFVSAASNAVSTAGDCANVKSAIDTLLENINDIISPEGNDFQIAADRLYFNRDYIAFETVGRTKNEYSYNLGNTTFNSYSFTGENTETNVRNDLEFVLISIISDLQTGGNNSAVDSIAKYITSTLRVTKIETILGQFIELLTQLKFLGSKAIQNYLYSISENPSGAGEYQAQYNTIAAYRDSETPTNIGNVVNRFESLVDSLIDVFTPSGDAGVSAAKQMLFNESYYKNEIAAVINGQFGSGSWTFEQFIDDIITDIEHDIITTDISTSNISQARKIDLLREGVLDVINFTSGAGYTSVPTIAIDAPPGSGGIQATADAVLSPNAVLTSIQIDAAGSGYTANGNYSFAGAPFVGTHGGYLTQTSGGITAVSYDGEIIDFNSSGSFTFGTGAAIANSGTAVGINGGFDVDYQYVRFGAGTAAYPQRSVVVDHVFNPASAGYDKVRVYIIAGNGSNGGDTPNDTEDLALYVSIDGYEFTYKDRLVYGGSAGGSNNVSNFASLNFVDLDLTIAEKEASNLRFEIRQMAHGTTSTADHYGVTRISCYNSDQAGFNLLNNGITVNFGQADTQSGTPTTPTLTFLSSRFLDQIVITNRGSGYLPATPPNATISGGNPTTPATVTNINVVLDSSRFTPGQLLISDQGASAEVYEDIGTAIYVGPITGTAFAAGQLLTQGGVSAEIASGGVGSPFDWYGSVGNVQTFNTIRNIASLVEDEESSINLLTNSETYSTTNWSIIGMNAPANNSDISPDGTSTTITFTPSAANGPKGLVRQINLTSYNTFDDSGLTFDSSGQTFDNGPNDTDARQQFTVSYFVKANGYSTIRHYFKVVPTTAYAFIQVNLLTGVVEQTFEVGTIGVLDLDASGAIPYGNGWYRVFLTGTFGYGFTNLQSELQILDNGAPNFAGDGSSGLFVWGSKFNTGGLDAYTAVGGQVFFSNIEYNIKKFALELFEDYTELALSNQLTNPAPLSGSIPFYNSALAADYNTNSIQRIIRENVKTLQSQLLDTDHYLSVNLVGNVTVPEKNFGERTIPVPLGGGIRGSDFLYGSLSDASSEVQNVIVNEGLVVKDYKRFRIDGEIQNGPFLMNENVSKQGDSTVQGVVYGFSSDENYKYLDVAVTGGTWALGDVIVGSTNGTTAELNALENRLQIIDVVGDFKVNSVFRGYTSNSTAATETFLKNEAAVLDNTGGKLVVDTETLNGSFETTSVVYPEESRLYVEVQKYAGFDIGVGDRIVANGYTRLGLSIQNNRSGFVVGNFVYKVTGGVADSNNYGIINKVDLDNNYIYVVPVVGGFQNGDTVIHLDISNILTGEGIVNTTLNVEGQAAGKVQFIEDAGLNKRLYISDTIGTIADTDSIKAGNGYEAAILSKVVLKARVNRFFRGFDGTQTTFDLTINNGDAYLPDPAGHMLIFINGILQPPGSLNAFTAFSDKIQFTEAPSLGSSFTGFYVGKLRQLDDISFEFDSLRQSFNLRRNDVFYSLTLTDGVQSSTIRPENNIIVSLNGVIQEPGGGFEIVGSRIIFNEIPRVGSTFVAFSYVGSEADVDAAEVIPPVEPGDLLDIQGEVSDREVAVIESSNSLVTFDYLGSVFGKDASASTSITSGTIRNVSVTSPGSGYTSRPTVRVDSISGFDAQVKALVGVGNVVVNVGGSGYQAPSIAIETTVPDDWTAPDLSLYGEEAIDPEIV